MKVAVEVFGKGMELQIGWGCLSLTLGRHLDMLMSDDGTRGRRWFDWGSSTTPGTFEFWLGRRHGTIDLGPALAWLAPRAGTERTITKAA